MLPPAGHMTQLILFYFGFIVYRPESVSHGEGGVAYETVNLIEVGVAYVSVFVTGVWPMCVSLIIRGVAYVSVIPI